MRQAYELFSSTVKHEFQVTFSATQTTDEPTKWPRTGAESFFLAYGNALEASIFISEAYVKGDYFVGAPTCELRFALNFSGTTVTVQGPSAEFVDPILNVFDANRDAAALPPETPIIFIGHGHQQDWIELRDHLRDQHKLEVIYYESDPRTGHIVPNEIVRMVEQSTFAVLVLTKEDQQKDGTFRARQNVVHELGLATAKLSMSRAIALIEDGVDFPSNISGVDYLAFKTGHIAMIFGKLLAVIQREFPRLPHKPAH